MSKTKTVTKISTNKIILIMLAGVLLIAGLIALGTVIVRNSNRNKYITCTLYTDTFKGTSPETTKTINHLDENEYYRIHFDDNTNFTLEYKLKNSGDVIKVKGTYTKDDTTLKLTFKNYPEENYGEVIFKKDGKTWVREQFIHTEETRFTRKQEFKLGK